MSYENLERIYNEKGILKFKLYSLTYIVDKTANGPVIYVETLPARKVSFSTFEDLIQSFTVYNEILLDNLNRIEVI